MPISSASTVSTSFLPPMSIIRIFREGVSASRAATLLAMIERCEPVSTMKS